MSTEIFDLLVHSMSCPRVLAAEKEELRLGRQVHTVDSQNLPLRSKYLLRVASLRLIPTNSRRICCSGPLLMRHGRPDSMQGLTLHGLIWYNMYLRVCFNLRNKRTSEELGDEF